MDFLEPVKSTDVVKREAVAKAAIERVGGAQNTIPIDKMLACEFEHPVMKAWHMLAQIDGLNTTLAECKDNIETDLAEIEKLEIQVRQKRRRIVEARKLFDRAIERKNSFEFDYEALENKIGHPITIDDVNKAAPKANVMRMFRLAVDSAIVSGGAPDKGDQLYLDEVAELDEVTVSNADLLFEVSNFCFEFTQDGQKLLKRFTKEDKKRFVQEMGEKYCGVR